MWIGPELHLNNQHSSSSSPLTLQRPGLRSIDNLLHATSNDSGIFKAALVSNTSNRERGMSRPRTRSLSTLNKKILNKDSIAIDPPSDSSDIDNIAGRKDDGMLEKTHSRSDPELPVQSKGQNSFIHDVQIPESSTKDNKQSYIDFDLDSSPIKKIPDNLFREPSPTRNILSSSPIKKKKSVAFSDDLASDLPSSPSQGFTPKKSILKSYLMNESSPSADPNNTSLWVKPSNNISNSYGPGNPNFWLQGTIIQLPPNSPDLSQLIEGCINVLRDKTFNKRFEVYATLNNICKTNSKDALLKLFTIPVKSLHPSPNKGKGNQRARSPASAEPNYISEISFLIRRDVANIECNIFPDGENKENINSPSKSDPFSIRIISQALKLINFIMLDNELNNFLPIEDARWFYYHSCSIIAKSNISKALISSYLIIIKECKFTNKRKKLIFDNFALPEQMLFSLINMKNFPSSTMVSERFAAFKNLVVNFPAMMAKNIKQWFGVLVINLCVLSNSIYSKCVTTGVQALLEVAKNFLDNKNALFTVRQFLDSPLPKSIKSITSEVDIIMDSGDEDSQQSVVEFIISNLESLIEDGQYKSSMDIWVAITLLAGDRESGFENWRYLSKWLKVHKMCFNAQDSSAKVVALTSWKAIIYNVCHNDLCNLRKIIDPVMNGQNGKSRQHAINNVLKPKVRLLIHTLLNVTAVENQKDIIDILHNLFLSIIYTLLNPLTIKSSTKYTHVYWDKVIQPVLLNFYFKKDVSSSYMNQLGLKVLTRLLRTSTPINDKNFNEMRCLANEPVSINEINSIPPRWVFSKFDKIMQNIMIIFQSEKLYIEQKMNFFNTFLCSLKLTTKKEMKASAATYDIIDNIPFVLETLFKHNKLSYDLAFKLVINLHDTFDPSSLINRANDQNEIESSTNVYQIIIENCISNLSSSQLKELMNLIVTSIDERKILLLLVDLTKLQLHTQSPELEHIILSTLNTRQVDRCQFELELYGELCQIVTKNFEIFVKKVIQSVVSISNTEEFKIAIGFLNIHLWALSIFKFYVLLVHDAPNDNLKQYSLNLILLKFENNESFVELVRFLIDNSFDHELYNLRKNIMTKAKDLQGFLQFDFRQVWKIYLSRKSQTNDNFGLLDELLLLAYEESEIDIKPYVRNNWDQLPLLKESWLKRNSELYIDQALIKLQEQGKQLGLERQRLVTENCEHDEEVEQKQMECAGNGAQIINSAESITCHNNGTTSDNGKDEAGESDDKKLLTLSPQEERQVKNSNMGECNDDVIIDKIKPVESKTEEQDNETVTASKTSPNKKKSKSPTAKTKSNKKSSKNKKEKEKEKPNLLEQNGGFDIHSFTALVTEKLSSSPPPKKTTRRKRNNQSTTSDFVLVESSASSNRVEEVLTDNVLQNQDGSNETKQQQQVPSILNNDTSIGELKTNLAPQFSVKDSDILCENSEFISSSCNEDKEPTASTPINKYAIDYSEIIQNGFNEEENRLSEPLQSPTKRKADVCQDTEEPNKRQKLFDCKESMLYESNNMTDIGANKAEKQVSLSDNESLNNNKECHKVNSSDEVIWSTDSKEKNRNVSDTNIIVEISGSTGMSTSSAFGSQNFQANSTAAANAPVDESIAQSEEMHSENFNEVSSDKIFHLQSNQEMDNTNVQGAKPTLSIVEEADELMEDHVLHSFEQNVKSDSSDKPFVDDRPVIFTAKESIHDPSQNQVMETSEEPVPVPDDIQTVSSKLRNQENAQEMSQLSSEVHEVTSLTKISNDPMEIDFPEPIANHQEACVQSEEPVSASAKEQGSLIEEQNTQTGETSSKFSVKDPFEVHVESSHQLAEVNKNIPKELSSSKLESVPPASPSEEQELQNMQNSISNLSTIVTSISDDEIGSLSEQERYHLETQLMKFMLRMRNVKPNRDK